MKKLISILVLASALFWFNPWTLDTDWAYAGGLGKDYICNGDTYVTVERGHKGCYSFGYVDPVSGDDLIVGNTCDTATLYVGNFDAEAVKFWADGKNKRYYTGHSNKDAFDNRFVINGNQFILTMDDVVDEAPADDPVDEEPVDEETPVEEPEVEPLPEIAPEPFIAATRVAPLDTADETDCSDLSIDYDPMSISTLYALRGRTGIETFRMIASGGTIDWTLFKNGKVKAIVTINDECAGTFNLTDDIEYFNLPDKDFEGYRLDAYDYPDSGSYIAKLRVTKERGVNKHYIYINNVDIVDLAGQVVSVKVALYQDDELVQAYAGSKTLKRIVK